MLVTDLCVIISKINLIKLIVEKITDSPLGQMRDFAHGFSLFLFCLFLTSCSHVGKEYVKIFKQQHKDEMTICYNQWMPLWICVQLSLESKASI